MWEILRGTTKPVKKNEDTYKQLLLGKDREQCQLLAECAAGDTGGYGENSRMEGLDGW